MLAASTSLLPSLLRPHLAGSLDSAPSADQLLIQHLTPAGTALSDTPEQASQLAASVGARPVEHRDSTAAPESAAKPLCSPGRSFWRASDLLSLDQGRNKSKAGQPGDERQLGVSADWDSDEEEAAHMYDLLQRQAERMASTRQQAPQASSHPTAAVLRMQWRASESAAIGATKHHAAHASILPKTAQESTQPGLLSRQRTEKDLASFELLDELDFGWRDCSTGGAAATTELPQNRAPLGELQINESAIEDRMAEQQCLEAEADWQSGQYIVFMDEDTMCHEPGEKSAPAEVVQHSTEQRAQICNTAAEQADILVPVAPSSQTSGGELHQSLPLERIDLWHETPVDACHVIFVDSMESSPSAAPVLHHSHAEQQRSASKENAVLSEGELNVVMSIDGSAEDDVLQNDHKHSEQTRPIDIDNHLMDDCLLDVPAVVSVDLPDKQHRTGKEPKLCSSQADALRYVEYCIAQLDSQKC